MTIDQDAVEKGTTWSPEVRQILRRVAMGHTTPRMVGRICKCGVRVYTRAGVVLEDQQLAMIPPGPFHDGWYVQRVFPVHNLQRHYSTGFWPWVGRICKCGVRVYTRAGVVLEDQQLAMIPPGPFHDGWYVQRVFPVHNCPQRAA